MHRACLYMAVLMTFLTLGLAWPCRASDSDTHNTLSLTTDFSYISGPRDTPQEARALALFGAQFKAVKLAAKYLVHKGRLAHYGKRQNEIYCLATEEIKTTVIAENFNLQTQRYDFKISTEIASIDFIKAEIKNQELDKKETHFSYGREMEQPVLPDILPARELSRALRYIRKGQWRIAVIYLDHLEKKYPHWGEIYFAKAIALYGMDDHEGMLKALGEACVRSSQEACDEHKSLTTP